VSKTKKYSGLAVQRTNEKFLKLSRVMKKLKKAKENDADGSVEELTQVLYPEWKDMTREEFENKM